MNDYTYLSPSKAAARRWLDSHVGTYVDTEQVSARTGRTWAPGSRLVAACGRQHVLDDSFVQIVPEHTVDAITDTTLVLTWHDENGLPIHTTTYTAK